MKPGKRADSRHFEVSAARVLRFPVARDPPVPQFILAQFQQPAIETRAAPGRLQIQGDPGPNADNQVIVGIDLIWHTTHSVYGAIQTRHKDVPHFMFHFTWNIFVGCLPFYGARNWLNMWCVAIYDAINMLIVP